MHGPRERMCKPEMYLEVNDHSAIGVSMDQLGSRQRPKRNNNKRRGKTTIPSGRAEKAEVRVVS